MHYYSTIEDTKALLGQIEQQHYMYMYYYNRHAQDPQPIAARVTIRIRLLGQSTWTIGVCTGRQGPQSYGVKLGETEYRHNCRQNIYTEEMPNLELTDPESREAPTAKTDDQQGSMNS